MFNIPTKTANGGASQAGKHLYGEFNNYIAELMKAITAPGLTLTTYPADPDSTADSNTQMLAEAMARMASYGVTGYDTGSANTYVVNPMLSSLVEPQSLLANLFVTFAPANANTGASTANVFALGVKPIVTWQGTTLSGGELVATKPVSLMYSTGIISGGAWILLPWTSSATTPTIDYYAVDTSSTPNVVTAAFSPAIPSMASIVGKLIRIKIANINTGATTIALNGFTAVSIKSPSGNAMIAGEIVAGEIAVMVFDGTNMQLIESIPAGGVSAQVIKSSGIYTPTPGSKTALVFATGGGGGGGGSSINALGAGGGAGGTAISVVGLVSVSTVSCTIGAGGTGGGPAADGSAGGTTSFGSYAVATGGTGGLGSAGSLYGNAGGFGGVGTTGLMLLSGQAGGGGMGSLNGGTGGTSFFGGGGCGAGQDTTSRSFSNGQASGNYGGGGGGADAPGGTGFSGGAGATGVILIIEFA